jgi:ethanolamine utilization protein EutA
MVILLFAGDLGSMVGINNREETPIQKYLICLDELMLEEGDWVDIGAPLYSGHTFPVTVKSLAFNQD